MLHSVISRINDVIQSFFSSIVIAGTGFKSVAILYGVVLIGLFVISVKIVMPVVGQELMPPMDTGAVNIKITTESNLPIGKSEAIMEKVNVIVQKQGKLLRLSGSIGSEAGVLSIGSGSGIDHLSIVATYVNRHERQEDIWQIAKVLRLEISKIPNIKQLEITPYGATALASIRASVNTLLSSPNYELLQEVGVEVEKAMNNTQGIISVAKTWDSDKTVYNLEIDEQLAMEYALRRSDVTAQIQMMLRGVPVATFPKANSMDYTVRVWLPDRCYLSTLIVTPKGKIPLKPH